MSFDWTKVKTRHGTLRYQTPIGKKVYGGRSGDIRRVIAEQVLSGWGKEFEVRFTGDNVFKTVVMTFEDAEDIIHRSVINPRHRDEAVERLTRRRDRNRLSWALKEAS